MQLLRSLLSLSQASWVLLFLQGMGGASMGIWCAHGEGRAHFPDPQVKQTVLEGGLAPIRLTPPPPSGIPVASREHVDIKVVLCMASCPRQDLAIHQAVAVLFGIEACLHTFGPHNMFSSLTFLPILHPKHA